MGHRQRASARRQGAILDAALELFDRRGIAATSVEEICTASGASIGSVYHHFGSKEGIAAALYVEAIADYQAELQGLLARAPDARAGVRGIVRHFLRWVKADPARARLMLAVEHAPVRELAREEVVRLNKEFLPRVGQWFAARPGLRRVPPDVFFCALLGPARRFAELWLDRRTRTPPASAARLLADLAWRSLSET